MINPAMPGGKRSGADFPIRLLICLILSLCVLVVFWGVQYQGFINYDDIPYVVENGHVQGGLNGAGFLWALRSTDVSNWHPLTWLSLMADYELYGLYPGGYHWTNVILHLLGTILLFLALERMTGAAGRSFFVALLFGIHPLHVESVAWISERKDVLSGLFWAGTLWFYALYTERGAWRWYVAALASFVFGLLSKPMVVTLPFVLLLLDYWPLGRLRLGGDAAAGQRGPAGFTETAFPLLREKVPFFLLSGISCAATYVAQYRWGAITAMDVLPFGVRLGNALVSYGRYFLKMIWPVDLAVFYPYPLPWSFGDMAPGAVFLAGVSALAIWFWQRQPYLLVGWFWYVGTLVPVIGLVQVGEQAMADRYTYIPLTGLFIVLTWAAGDWAAKGKRRAAALAIPVGAAAVALMICSRVQTGYWKDSLSVFGHAVQVTKNNYLAHNNLGAALFEHGDVARATAEYVEALRIKPRYAEAHSNLGLALAARGKLAEAMTHYVEALRVKPDSPETLNNLGLALAMQGKTDDAIARYERAISIKPDYLAALSNLGLVLAAQGKADAAISRYEEALRFAPENAEVHNNLGICLADQGRLQDAVVHFLTALRLKPDYGEARNNLGTSLARLGKMEPAAASFREALQIDPGNATAHNNLGLALSALGDREGAHVHFREALRLRPDYADARRNLDILLQGTGRP